MDQLNGYYLHPSKVYRGLQAWSWWEVMSANIWGLLWGNRMSRSSWYPSQPDCFWRPFLRIQQPHQRKHLRTDPQGHIQVNTQAVHEVKHVKHCAICISAGKQFCWIWASGSCVDIHDRIFLTSIKSNSEKETLVYNKLLFFLQDLSVCVDL